MPDHNLPDDFQEKSEMVRQRWKWYLEADRNSITYFQRYVVESIKHDVITKVSEVCEHSVPAGVQIIDNLIDALHELRGKTNLSKKSSNESLNE